MSININPTQSSYETQVTQAANTTSATQAEETKTNVGVDTKDTYEKDSAQTKSYATDYDKIKTLKADFSRQVTAFNKMVETLFSRQAGASKGMSFNLLEQMDMGNIKACMEALANDIDPATQAEAQALVAEDGYFGVEQTAQRIVDFAKALSGGDPSKISLLKDAVSKGFDQAKSAWGGDLPDISGKTYDRIQELFNEWENGSTAAAETETEAE